MRFCLFWGFLEGDKLHRGFRSLCPMAAFLSKLSYVVAVTLVCHVDRQCHYFTKLLFLIFFFDARMRLSTFFVVRLRRSAISL